MPFKDAEARVAELLSRYGREAEKPEKQTYEALCQVIGSNNRVIIHVHYARCDEAMAKSAAG